MRSNVRIIRKNKEETSNLEYWLTRTPTERLEAVQLLREQYIRSFNKQGLYRESRKGLRRVYKVTQRTKKGKGMSAAVFLLKRKLSSR